MAGDFYTGESYSIGIEDGITKQTATFKEAVKYMADDLQGYIGKLNQLLDQETDAIKQIVGHSGGDGTAAAYKKHGPGFPSDKAFSDALGLLGIRYGTMAWKNFDHFVSLSLPVYSVNEAQSNMQS